MIDNYTLFLLKENSKIDITNRIGNLSWGDTLESLGVELTFDIARNPFDRYIQDVVEIGDKLILMNNGAEVTNGIITDIEWGLFQKTVTAFDYAFYLNQSKIVKQFYKVQASQAIRKLCSEFTIPVGKITEIATNITKIYKDSTVAEIIKDILKQATQELGIEYRLEMRRGKLYIEPYTDLVVKATYQRAKNTAPFDVAKVVGNVTKTESIQEMKNSIIVVSTDEEDGNVVVQEKDDSSISKYGLLQEVLSLDEEELSKARNVAKNELKKLNRVAQDISVELLGSDKVRSGRILEIQNAEFGLEGKYLVKSCLHSYQNGIHKMELGLQEVELS